MRENNMNIYDLIISITNNLGSYHHQKEQMAFRAVLTYLVGTTVLVFTGDKIWNGFSGIEIWCFISEKVIIRFVIILTGILAILYVIWQLGNRRYAAQMVTACTNLSSRWVEKSPKDNDVKPILFNNNRWVHNSSLWPKALVNEYNEIRSKTEFYGGPKPSEWLLYIVMVIWGQRP